MKTTINTKSHNEVKEILNEYVVSPLNTDISTTLSKMSTEIESLEENTKANKKNICTFVDGNISNLKSLLDLSFHFDEEEDVFDTLNNKIEDSQDNITDEIDRSNTELSTIISNLQTVMSTQIKSLEENTKKNIYTSVSGNIENLKRLEKDAFENLSDKMEESQDNITDKIDESNTELQKKIQTTSDLIEQKYKTLFAVSLSFGIANALGVIAMIILFLIK